MRSLEPGRAEARWIRFRGLRARLVVAFLLVALGTGVATTVISLGISRTALLQTTQDELMEAFLARVTEVAEDVPRLDEDSLPEFAAGLGGAYYISHRENGMITEETTWPVDIRVPAELTARVQGGDRVYFQRAIRDEQPYLYVGTAVLEELQPSGIEVYQRFSLENQEQSLHSLQSGSVLTLAASSAAALLLALIAAGSVLRPIRDLNRGARRLGEGALNTRLPVRGKDELAGLVTNFNNAAAQLESSVDELRRQEANSRRFVADVSHELRTPLAAMVATAETLESELGRLDGDGAAAARSLITETSRMAELVENLIEVSRFDARRATLVVEEIDLDELVRSSLAARRWADDVYVHIDAAVTLSADPRRVDVIVSNLVGNALGHGRKPVTVTVFGDSDSAGVSVRDSGAALDPEVASHVFERFYKADQSRRRSEGSGLGLAIALENARLHGGRIEVRSEPGAGTTFTLVLPLEPSEQGPAESKPTPSAIGLPHELAEEEAQP